MKKLNRIMPWAIVCLGFVLFVGCGDPGPVGQESINPPAEEGADVSDDQTTLESGDEG